MLPFCTKNQPEEFPNHPVSTTALKLLDQISSVLIRHKLQTLGRVSRPPNPPNLVARNLQKSWTAATWQYEKQLWNPLTLTGTTLAARSKKPTFAHAPEQTPPFSTEYTLGQCCRPFGFFYDSLRETPVLSFQYLRFLWWRLVLR